MNVVTSKHLVEAEGRYRDAAKEIRAWNRVARAARWRNFAGVREVFKDADAIGGYVVFNIRRNRYRLVTIIHCSRAKDDLITEGHICIRSFLTYKEYDNKANWDKGVKR